MGEVSPRPIILKNESPGSPSSLGGDRPSQITKLSISRNYVIPPRPKPGRKPSNDIPPSRRKAQNRDAQRAFRERKSQAVRVLEDQLAKQAQEFEKQQIAMREQILLLQKQNTKLQHVPESPSSPEVNSGVTIQSIQPHAPQAGSPMQPQTPTIIPMLTPIQFRPVMAPSPHHFQPQPMSPQHLGSPQSPGTPFGTPVTPADVAGLELLDHVLDQKLPVQQQQQQQSLSISPSKLARRASRSTKSSPESPQSPGVVRIEPPAARSPLDLVNTNWSQPAVPLRRRSRALEVDFTTAFTPRSPRPLSLPSPPALKDRCGFCTDNTLCICAASAAREEGADIAPDLATLGSPMGPGENGSMIGIVNDHSGLSKSRRSSLSQSVETVKPVGSPDVHDDSPSECSGNPGNCSQCRQDPMLTLFCSAVASKAPSVRMPMLGTFIPAQAAYKTLSRHPRFSDADLGEVVNVLLVKSSQVEVNSVAKVLRLLDTK